MLGAMEGLPTLDPQGRRADPLDPRAHPDEAVGEIDDLGLARGVLDQVSPRASTAAIKALWVAPTDTLESSMRLPVKPRGARATT